MGLSKEQTQLVEAVDEVCRSFRGSVNSWWRSPSHNAAQPGSVPNSQHLHGLAMDVVYDGGFPPAQAVIAILARHATTLQLVREKGHDHIEQDPHLLAKAASPPLPVA